MPAGCVQAHGRSTRQRSSPRKEHRVMSTPAWKRGMAAIALAGAAFGAQAVSYFSWQAVELPASSGASCGNGTPYRFFVNRTPFTSRTVVVYEGGGACWDQKACLGGSLLSASNPDGVAANYMQDLTHQLSTPFTARLDPLQSVRTQGWNIVFLPYCTGDVHTGNATAIYSDVDATKPLAYSHRGAVNSEQVAAWLKANLSRPQQLLVTGFSAGGAGATSNYAVIRAALNPAKSALLADSGPLYPAPRSGSDEQYPSLRLQNRIRVAWGLDGSEGLVTKLLARYPGAGSADDLGSVSTGLAKVFPQDRFGYALFQQDAVYSDFSYTKFHPEIAEAAPAMKPVLLNVLWRRDIANWLPELRSRPNVGYYVPYARDLLGSHCLTTLTFGGTAIQEARLKNVGSFIDNLLDDGGTPIRAYESRQVEQSTFGWLGEVVAWLVSLFPKA
ncbi:MAG: hypothetical protein EPO01_04300 [Aquabacterium sp.]|nr:MAG: hypothetical protein EPO01_04300 [Aquabacterium sp.]